MKRIERKKILARISMCLVAVMIMFITAGCQQNSQTPSGTEDSQSDYPAKGITLIVPFAAGGGMDTTGRLLAPALEKQLGTTVTIINKEGSYGWLGWTELNQAAPDGYTLGLANFPAMITGYLDPTNDVGITVKEYTPIANVVSDINILVAKKEETRFTNLEELLEYSKNNVIKAADTASAGDDHVALLKVNKEMGTNWSIVHFPGAAEAVAAVMGGHIDLLVCNIGEVAGQVNDGELLGLGIFDKERSEYVPDVPTLEESGWGAIYNASNRGLFAPPNLDPAVRELLINAATAAMEDPEFLEAAKNVGMNIDAFAGDEYVTWLDEQDNTLRGMVKDFGW